MRCVTCGEPNPKDVDPCPECGAGVVRGPRSAAELEAAFAAGADDRPPQAAGPLRVGQDFGTRYTVLKLLGTGGMGVVYQVLDRDLGVPVALKVLRLPSGDPRAVSEMKRRFKTELLLARKVTHKNVIRIHDIGEIDGIRFITMPFVNGQDLATILKKGALSVTRAVRYGRQLASGLAAAHAAGVVHRDLKPPNVMIGEDDEALLMDFGIARSSAPGGPQRTIAGAVVGTAAYMAPEQARGEPVDHRADIYAFGLILYEMLCGPRFMPKGAVADLFARMTAAPGAARAANRQVPEALDAIVTRCVQPGVEERYQSAVELVAALAALSRRGHGPVPGRPPAPKRWPLRAAAAAVVLALGGLAYWAIPRMDVKAMAVGPDPAPVVGSDPVAGSDPSPGSDPTRPLPRGSAKTVAALEAKRRASANAPGSAALRKDVAVYSLYAGDLAGATREAEEAVKADPRLVTAYVPLAAAAALTAPDTARIHYERLATVTPGGPSLAASGLADLALYQRRYDDAAKVLELSITNDAHFGNRPALATKYLALAEARVGQGRPSDAETAVERALDASRHENVLLPAARLYLTLDHEVKALALARELHARATEQARAYAGIVNAEAAMRRGQATQAIDTLRNVVEATDLWLAHFVLGTAYVQSQRYADAMSELEMCGTRRGEAAILFMDDVPTIRYLAALQDWMSRARAGLTVLP
ncbi:MAG TPA: protein kinase [Vicinamibacterales bacterium]